jgi:hypothetical protein
MSIVYIDSPEAMNGRLSRRFTVVRVTRTTVSTQFSLQNQKTLLIFFSVPVSGNNIHEARKGNTAVELMVGESSRGFRCAM